MKLTPVRRFTNPDHSIESFHKKRLPRNYEAAFSAFVSAVPMALACLSKDIAQSGPFQEITPPSTGMALKGGPATLR